ncbi:MAG TPA: serine/threonine-protein kinase, partial [Terriglobia bacterium]|nr:serine/threonine-protein kinase [Terriglobia bacterium]
MAQLEDHSRPLTRALRPSEEPTVRMEREARPAGGDEQAAARTAGVSASAFVPNQVVAGRFRIVRLIGRGGMGEVYEAEDLELRERVALKTVRTRGAPDRRAVERFKREINLARKVTHPNVCRTFDLYHHRPDPESPDGEDGEVTFLSMELLPGETLAERIRRRGRMSISEALPIVQQMAVALHAAERAGIVHRDFKSQNVILVEPEDSCGMVRAVVTDFGLARLAARPSDTAQSSVGDFAGSPAYMAPEQIEGGEVTAATDVYALGVVMYEMVTGVLPFAGDSPLETAVKRLKESPPAPRSLVSGLDPRRERVILRCLERDPARRFRSAADVSQALAGELSPAVFGRRNRRSVIWGSAAAAIVLAAALVHLKAGRRTPRFASVSRESTAASSPSATNVRVTEPAKA